MMINDPKISDELSTYYAKLSTIVELITRLALEETNSDRTFDRVFRNNLEYLSKADMAGILAVSIIGTVFETGWHYSAKSISQSDSPNLKE